MCFVFLRRKTYSPVGVWVAPVRTGHAEMEQELRPGVCKPRVLSFMLSEVKDKPEAQAMDSSRQDRANVLWRSRQAGSGSQMAGYLETTAPAGRKGILVLKEELSHFWLPDCFW